jgi:hypothetical protein
VIDTAANPPDPTRCQSSEDVGRLHHDETLDVWYECFWDTRHRVYCWAIVPPVDEPQ